MTSGKISTTKTPRRPSVPRWKLVGAKVGYALLSGNIYYDTTGVVRQNNSPMSVLRRPLTRISRSGLSVWTTGSCSRSHPTRMCCRCLNLR